MRILGIDPGVATVGFGVIDSEGGRQRMVRYGAITTPAGMPLAARLVQIGGDLEQLIRQFQPDQLLHRGAVFQQEHHHRHCRGPRAGGAAVHGGEAAPAGI